MSTTNEKGELSLQCCVTLGDCSQLAGIRLILAFAFRTYLDSGGLSGVSQLPHNTAKLANYQKVALLTSHYTSLTLSDSEDVSKRIKKDVCGTAKQARCWKLK